MPADEQYPLITLWDPQQNRIGQWTNVAHQQGIVDLTYELNPEPPMGTYKIEVTTSKGKEFHLFEVDEYVLPKFEVTLQFPDLITIIDKIHQRQSVREVHLWETHAGRGERHCLLEAILLCPGSGLMSPCCGQ
ncbi:ovostatin-like, partial [Hypanus sabinus]|uniref:ovostatin-like n=1 Tax=Hypanus sabinus TaxID=79690 RepID=UPI0028C4B212